MRHVFLPALVAVAAVPLAAQCLIPAPHVSNTGGNGGSQSSPLSRLNEHLPDWLCISAGYRARVEGFSGGGFRSGNADDYLLSRLRLGTLIHPSRWFKVYAELQDATAFGKTPPAVPQDQSTWDLRRAYADVGDTEKGFASLRVGRQDLGFGSGRVVGTSYWRNVSRGFDAVMLSLKKKWIAVSTFSASRVVASHNGLSHHKQGTNLHGIYVVLRDRIPSSLIEPYVLWSLAPSLKTEAGLPAKRDEKTAGVRWAGMASRFDYDVESAFQAGTISSDYIRAWAWAGILGYTFDSASMKPRVFAEYNFASGDRNPVDGKRGTFDQLYPNIHGHHGIADQVGWQNLKEIRAGWKVVPSRKWTLAATFNDWWLASATDAFYSSAGAVIARDTSGRSGTHIGVELDAETTYRVNPEIELGAGMGYIFPGGFLKQTNHNHAYTYPYLMLHYNFF